MKGREPGTMLFASRYRAEVPEKNAQFTRDDVVARLRGDFSFRAASARSWRVIPVCVSLQ